MGIFGRDEPTPDVRRTQPSAQPTDTPAPLESPDRTMIARPSTIDGRISGSGEIVVNGLVNGTIEATGRVIIAAQGRVEATVHGKTVTVAGAVVGDITADERIELSASARVEGDITAPRILIEDGATFRGQVNMEDPGARTELKTSSARKPTSEPPHA